MPFLKCVVSVGGYLLSNDQKPEVKRGPSFFSVTSLYVRLQGKPYHCTQQENSSSRENISWAPHEIQSLLDQTPGTCYYCLTFSLPVSHPLCHFTGVYITLLLYCYKSNYWIYKYSCVFLLIILWISYRFN